MLMTKADKMMQMRLSEHKWDQATSLAFQGSSTYLHFLGQYGNHNPIH